MSDQLEIRDINLWRKKLGLFPVPLFGRDAKENEFVLLNGNKGNFCLDLSNEQLGSEARNRAWSSNVGHYVTLDDQNRYVEVQSWDQRASTINRYSYESVATNLEGFHRYLIKDEPKSEISVISHVIRVYRSLRSALGQSADGTDSLKAFLYLLACVTDGVRRDKLALKKWGLDAQAGRIAKLIRDNEWSALEGELIRERPLESLTPILSLILRHSSGQIFQEAHYEAIFVRQPQLMFEGFAPQPIEIGKHGKGIGLHFTPPALARTLVEEALLTLDKLPKNSITIFDPSCGSGEFLREVLRQLIIKKYRGKIKLIGWDISPAACDMARFGLAWEMRGHNTQVNMQIECVDSLSSDEKWPEVDLILMNPPFVSWQDMNLEQRERVREILGNLMVKQPDMSNAFIWRAALCLRQGGVVGSILPASFLNGVATTKLRGEIGQAVSTRLVARLGSHMLFPGAMIDAALYVGRADNKNDAPAIAFWADYRSASNARGLRALRIIRSTPQQAMFLADGDGYSIYPNPEIGKGSESWAPRPYKSWSLLHSLNHLPKVKDIFNVMKGAQTGHNKTFILDKEQWQELPDSEKVYFRPAVLNKSIRHGFLIDSAYVFYPYGESAIETEAKLRKAVKTFYDKVLKDNKERLLNRTGVNPEKWWKLYRYGTWQVDNVPQLVSTFFGDAGSFAWDETGQYIVIQGNSWLLKPTKGFTELPENVALAYLAILSSPIFSELLSATCNHVGGGQWDLSKRFVNNIAIPNLLSTSMPPRIISDLSEIGKSIHEGLPFEDERLKELTSLVYQPNQVL